MIYVHLARGQNISGRKDQPSIPHGPTFGPYIGVEYKYGRPSRMKLLKRGGGVDVLYVITMVGTVHYDGVWWESATFFTEKPEAVDVFSRAKAE